jgi:myo-inositol-1-phosphate synthase
VKIWLVGARGTIATTTTVGTLAVQEGLLPLEGAISATPVFADIDLARVEELSFGGCDLRPGTMADAVLACPSIGTVFSFPVLQQLLPRLEDLPITPGILRGAGEAVRGLADAGVGELLDEGARAAVDRIMRDLRAFAGDEPAVVVNLASTEPLADPALELWDLETFERALEEDDPRIPASALYAYAALRAGIPYVNFTPSAGASLPALVELALQTGVPVAGRDGKTGETLVKTALAPMFAMRALRVEGWYGANILGNLDGQVLAQAENAASKIASKSGVLEECLGYQPDGQVRIDYFPPLKDHKVAWDFIQFRGWGGHSMRMQFTWEGTDAVLAAPLILDLARLIDLARRRGEGGPIGALALFFKSPEGTTEMSLHRQYDLLLSWARGTLRGNGDAPVRKGASPDRVDTAGVGKDGSPDPGEAASNHNGVAPARVSARLTANNSA